MDGRDRGAIPSVKPRPDQRGRRPRRVFSSAVRASTSKRCGDAVASASVPSWSRAPVCRQREAAVPSRIRAAGWSDRRRGRLCRSATARAACTTARVRWSGHSPGAARVRGRPRRYAEETKRMLSGPHTGVITASPYCVGCGSSLSRIAANLAVQADGTYAQRQCSARPDAHWRSPSLSKHCAVSNVKPERRHGAAPRQQ